MSYIERCEEITGYKVRVVRREAFRVVGYTLIVPPRSDKRTVARFWDDVEAHGRLAALAACSAEPPWVLGLGSWDPECQKGGQRYTVCNEETNQTDFTALAREQPLFTKDTGASDWMCFEMTHQKYGERFWDDDPYKMMGMLGYRFHKGNLSVGLHFDAYPPGFDEDRNPAMEFRITVIGP